MSLLGFENRYHWLYSIHNSSIISWSSSLSINSAITFDQFICAKSTILLTICLFSLLLAIHFIKLPSIFKKSGFKLIILAKFEYHVPKSSIAIFTPNFLNISIFLYRESICVIFSNTSKVSLSACIQDFIILSSIKSIIFLSDKSFSVIFTEKLNQVSLILSIVCVIITFVISFIINDFSAASKNSPGL
jgi:hypothetical protein